MHGATTMEADVRFCFIILLVLLIAPLNTGAAAEEKETEAWYHKRYTKPVPQTLKAALASTRSFLGDHNKGWRQVGSKEACDALKPLSVSCDYNTRSILSMFLTVHGKGLFPWSGKTNRYVDDDFLVKMGFPDDVFVGQPVQNKMLADAVRRNAHLFLDGDLTADVVKAQWK